MKKIVLGILAHVDAGKTTLAEALLYTTGKIRKPGRVDHGNTALDTHILERERGITIFASQAVFETPHYEITLLDTPGHVDFSAETERTLQVLDYAVLVISGIDGVQAHTRTLWRLLSMYQIPTFLFVTKMDFARKSREELMTELKNELSADCIDFTPDRKELRWEESAATREDVLEKYLDTGSVSDADTASLIKSRCIFPCVFGSGLKFEGIGEFIDLLDTYFIPNDYPADFGARVFKITHDDAGSKLTHLKVTGGTLRVRDGILIDGKEEKAAQIRILNGSRSVPVEEANAGTVCAVIGLESSRNGQGFGREARSAEPVLEPVMNYRIELPDGVDPKVFMPKLRLLEEEDPLLHVTWNSHLQEIHVGLMGEIQAEILHSLIAERFDIDVKIGSGRVMYKETICGEVEGVGHYEPLRHYAEVHLLLEPLPRGTGLLFECAVKQDTLDINWQRLIMLHLTEKQHLGVLTGSPVTDMKITLAAGRAHLKHTEGGDFRQATYRAVRQGLMQAESRLLEPCFSFRLEIPSDQLGRAINDIHSMAGSFDPPENTGDFCVLKGLCPVATMNSYAAEVASYTSGRGRLQCDLAGYYDCHNEKEVVALLAYSPESDLENTPDSVFCAHGGGFGVKWDKVPEYMHLESCLKKERPFSPSVNHRNLHIDDKELQAIMEREFGKVKYELRREKAPEKPSAAVEEKSLEERQQYVLVDGYNVIFAWDDLKQLALEDLEEARNKLMHVLSNYSAFTKNKVVLVFDAYRVQGNPGKRFQYNNINVVFTKERELGDVYISKLISEIGKNEKVRVVTSDNLIQLSAVQFGVLRMSAQEFEKEVDEVHAKIGEFIEETKLNEPKNTIGSF